MVPADAQLPLPDAGLKRSVDDSVEPPLLLPPAKRTLPFATIVAVCSSRALDSEVRVLHDEVPSKSCTLVRTEVAERPPTTSTLLLSDELVVASSVAV
jgi:hypothetical protein